MARTTATNRAVLHIAASAGAPIEVAEFARTKREQSKRRASSKSIGGRDPSLRWPHLYDILRAKGHDKSTAAAISNAHLRKRKKGRLEGLPWKKADNKKELRKLLASAVVASCYSKVCAPPPVGKGGSESGGTPLAE